MGYAMVMSPCFSCNRTFSYHPHKVPSIRVEGVRQPVCRTCMEQANAIRVQRGEAPHEINPDAYSPCREEEL